MVISWWEPPSPANLSSFSMSHKDRRPLKIILVGSSGVGKTSLINSFFDHSYESEQQPTVAPSFCGATLQIGDGSKVDLQIWDTAGQERYQSIGGMFYRESDIAFVCFDRENIETIPSWIARVRAQVSDCAIFLVLTKSDLIDEAAMVKTRQDIDAAANDAKAAKVFVTSAAKGINVKQLFSEAAEYINVICKPAPALSLPIDQGQQKGSCKC